MSTVSFRSGGGIGGGIGLSVGSDLGSGYGLTVPNESILMSRRRSSIQKLENRSIIIPPVIPDKNRNGNLSSSETQI